jgi:2-methylisocitrate lyase-like PEP mutase family enzyme
MSPGRRLRDRLARPGIIRTLTAHDVFTAKILEQAGLEMLFLGGFGIAASHLGVPDLSLLTLSEMADAVRRVTAAVSVPVVADGDTGHGDLPNVVRTVRDFERAGAAGVLLEDQVFPKRCGHFAGKQVIPADDMVLKLRTALAARRDPDFLIFARTDALTVEGIDAAIARANLYRDTGADVCFVEAPQSREDLARIAKEVRAPQLANMLVGGKTPLLSADELEALGFRIMVCPVTTLLAAGFAIRRAAKEFLESGRVDTHPESMLTFDELKQLLGLEEHLSWRERLET